MLRLEEQCPSTEKSSVCISLSKNEINNISASSPPLWAASAGGHLNV